MEMQSRKDAGKKETLSWPDVQFHITLDVYHAKTSGDRDRYERAVSGLSTIMAGFYDDEYFADMQVLEEKCAALQHSMSPDQLFMVKMDEKWEILSKLVYRCNQGRLRVKETVEQSLVIKEIASKILKGIGQNIVITGPLGSGKSEAAMKIAQEVSLLTNHKWSVDDVVFTPLDFVMRYNNKAKTPKGADLILDEIGVTHGARTSQSKANIQFNKIFQVLRHRELLCIFTLPDLSMMDVTARKLMHWWFQTDSLDKKKGVCYIIPHVVEVVQASGDILYPFPMFNGNQLTELQIKAVSQQTRDEYKKRSAKYKDDVSLAVEKELYAIDGEVRDAKFEEYYKLREQGILTVKATQMVGISTVLGAKYRLRYDKLKYLEKEKQAARDLLESAEAAVSNAS